MNHPSSSAHRQAPPSQAAPISAITVIIPNWNGMRWLPECLGALKRQTWQDFETVVVDNASTDGSFEWLERQAPEIRRIRMDRNTGFAAAVNVGIHATRSPLVALLNTDTRIAPDWLVVLRETLLQADPDVAAVCGKLLRMETPDRIENAGDSLSWWGLARKRGHDQPSTAFDQAGEIFSCCAGAALYRRSLFDVVGDFDAAFFAYLEDIDLGLRARLRGWRFRYVPDARALHHGHGSGMPSHQYVRRCTANRLRLFYQNLPASALWRHAPTLIAGQCWAAMCHRRPGATLAGLVDVARDLPRLRKIRRQNLRQITLSPGEVARCLRPAPATSTARKPSICFHLASPPPRWSGTEAVAQDVTRLQQRFGARMYHVFPGRHPSRWVPGFLFGWHVLLSLRAADRQGAIHHVLGACPRPFLYLRFLRGPLVYTITAAAGHTPPRGSLCRRTEWIVTHARDAASTDAWPGARVTHITPGIDLSHVRLHPRSSAQPFRLLMASAPWTRGQFRDKGIDLLLDALRRDSDLHLTLLWRGMHTRLLLRRIHQAKLTERVEVINRVTDINTVLAKAQAVVLLARHSRLVKAWPHSLLEGLAAGRPVLLTRTIPFSDIVEKENWGVILEEFSSTALKCGLEELRSRQSEWDPDRLSRDVRQRADPERHDAELRRVYEKHKSRG